MRDTFITISLSGGENPGWDMGGTMVRLVRIPGRAEGIVPIVPSSLLDPHRHRDLTLQHSGPLTRCPRGEKLSWRDNGPRSGQAFPWQVQPKVGNQRLSREDLSRTQGEGEPARRALRSPPPFLGVTPSPGRTSARIRLKLFASPPVLRQDFFLEMVRAQHATKRAEDDGGPTTR
jgi:hypothetical protein